MRLAPSVVVYFFNADVVSIIAHVQFHDILVALVGASKLCAPSCPTRNRCKVSLASLALVLSYTLMGWAILYPSVLCLAIHWKTSEWLPKVAGSFRRNYFRAGEQRATCHATDDSQRMLILPRSPLGPNRETRWSACCLDRRSLKAWALCEVPQHSLAVTPRVVSISFT